MILDYEAKIGVLQNESSGLARSLNEKTQIIHKLEQELEQRRKEANVMKTRNGMYENTVREILNDAKEVIAGNEAGIQRGQESEGKNHAVSSYSGEKKKSGSPTLEKAFGLLLPTNSKLKPGEGRSPTRETAQKYNKEREFIVHLITRLNNVI